MRSIVKCRHWKLRYKNTQPMTKYASHQVEESEEEVAKGARPKRRSAGVTTRILDKKEARYISTLNSSGLREFALAVMRSRNLHSVCEYLISSILLETSFSHYIHVDSDEDVGQGQKKFNKAVKQEEERELRGLARDRNRAVARAMLRGVLR